MPFNFLHHNVTLVNSKFSALSDLLNHSIISNPETPFKYIWRGRLKMGYSKYRWLDIERTDNLKLEYLSSISYQV